MNRIVEKLERIAYALEKISLSKEVTKTEESKIKWEDEFLAAQAFSLSDGKTLVYGVSKYCNKDPQVSSIITKKTPYEAEKAMLESMIESAQGLGVVSNQVVLEVSNPFLQEELEFATLLSEPVRIYLKETVAFQLKLEHSDG
jgi:hypothetical protein